MIKSKSVKSTSGSFIGTGPKKYMESTTSAKFREQNTIDKAKTLKVKKDAPAWRPGGSGNKKEG